MIELVELNLNVVVWRTLDYFYPLQNRFHKYGHQKLKCLYKQHVTNQCAPEKCSGNYRLDM